MATKPSTASTTIKFGTGSNVKLKAKYIDQKDGTGLIEVRNIGERPLTVTALNCTTSLKSQNDTMDVVEVQVWALSRSFNLDSTANGEGIKSWRWLGSYADGDNPGLRPSYKLAADRVTVNLSHELIAGQAYIEYTEVFDVYKVKDIGEYGGVVVFQSIDRGDAAVEVPPQDGAAGKPKHVILEVRDYCKDIVLSEVTVTVTGPNGYTSTHITTSTGRIDLGVLQPGEYKTSLYKTGYLPNEDDLLANDGFEV